MTVRRPDVVIFDFDGLLRDTESTFLRSWQFERQQWGLERGLPTRQHRSASPHPPARQGAFGSGATGVLRSKDGVLSAKRST